MQAWVRSESLKRAGARVVTAADLTYDVAIRRGDGSWTAFGLRLKKRRQPDQVGRQRREIVFSIEITPWVLMSMTVERFWDLAALTTFA